ncbi:MAG: dienelactone hydrolase family protein [Pseudomonadota bacterium]|nr:dienelactone hydrolase family protein [Pseudomonadota bacterium]
MSSFIENHPLEDLAVQILAGDAVLEGNLRIPASPSGLVLFVHGSGSSRFSPRNQYVAQLLNQAGLATLLFDLLTEEENQIDIITKELRFDIALLSRRTVGALDWLTHQPQIKELAVGLFGASTGAAAALFAAEARPKQVSCVVSRGGRPDLAMPVLADVSSPTLLIVGGLDYQVLQLNEMAQQSMHTECELTVIPGATHLFEEPGTLEQAAEAAKNWFVQKLSH